ncbi:MAG: hypothetical protein GX964_05520 [Syntrophomonadaceae bacterium]|jgi:tetratricopeptide (TPR) repeat protein|nr:hypothetical protein [Syntrophomonadaceae bacterium]
MNDPRVRVLVGLLAIGVIVALFNYTPARFFLKMTVLIGLPFILLFLWWRRQPRFGIAWIVGVLVMGLLLGAYGMMMYSFPEQLQVKEIKKEGDILLAQGQYDRALDKYREIEPLNQKEAAKKMAEAREQKQFHETYLRARELAEQGEKEKARQVLKSIPRSAHVYSEAHKFLSQMEGGT